MSKEHHLLVRADSYVDLILYLPKNDWWHSTQLHCELVLLSKSTQSQKDSLGAAQKE